MTKDLIRNLFHRLLHCSQNTAEMSGYESTIVCDIHRAARSFLPITDDEGHSF